MKEMSLTDHLVELRNRLIKVAVIVVISFAVCYQFGDPLQEILLHPLRNALGSEGKVVFAGILDKVLTQFQLAFWSSLILSSPLWFTQIWFFIKPGLYEKEIKIIRPFIFLSFILFACGVAFGYFLVFPFTFKILIEWGALDSIEAFISLKQYIVLTSKILMFLGVLFQLPNVLLILGFMGIVSGKKLLDMSRYVVTAFAVLSAMLTPPDPITMLTLWIPLVSLYFLGVGLVFVLVDPWHRRDSDELININEDHSA